MEFYERQSHCHYYLVYNCYTEVYSEITSIKQVNSLQITIKTMWSCAPLQNLEMQYILPHVNLLWATFFYHTLFKQQQHQHQHDKNTVKSSEIPNILNRRLCNMTQLCNILKKRSMFVSIKNLHFENVLLSSSLFMGNTIKSPSAMFNTGILRDPHMRHTLH